MNEKIIALKTIGVTAVRTEAEYAVARSVVDYLSDQVEAYEDQHTVIPEATPAGPLRFLMQQHELKKEDLIDCAPQSRISDILNGRCAISKDLAKKFSRRFNVAADLLI
jgi:HTH-type transcriptional regulator/antitoxin HigA